MPWERDELWAPFISTMVMGGARRRQAFPFQGPGRAQASVRKMSASWAPGTKNPGPTLLLRPGGPGSPPLPLRPGVQAPPSSDLGSKSPPSPPQTWGVQAPTSPLRPRELRLPDPSLFIILKNPGSQSFLSQTPVANYQVIWG